MSHCAQLLEELAQADPELTSMLSGAGPRGILASAVALAGDPILLVLGSPTRVVYSDPVAQLFGRSHHRIFARPFEEAISLDDEPQDVLARALEVIGVDIVPGRFVAISIPDGQGRHCAILCIGDLEQERAGTHPATDESSRDNARPLRARQPGTPTLPSILEAIDQGCLIMNERFEVLAVNQMAARIARMSTAQILGASHWSLWPSSRDTPPSRMYRRVLQSGRAEQMEHHYVGDGIDIWLRIHAYRFAGGVVSLFRDITRNMRLIDAEGDHRARWNAAKAAVGTLWTLTASGRMEGRQPGWEAVCGQGVEDYRGYGWLAAIHPDDSEWITSAFEAAVDGRTRFEVTTRIKRPDASWRALRLCIVPVLRDTDQSLSEWVGAAHEAQA